MGTKVTGVVQAKTDKGGICIDDTWYNSYKSAGLSRVNKGDTISFEFEQKGQWKNIDGKTVKVETQPATSSSGTGRGGYSQLGVELGHAANLANTALLKTTTPDDADFFPAFEALTIEYFKRMKYLREAAEGGFKEYLSEGGDADQPF